MIARAFRGAAIAIALAAAIDPGVALAGRSRPRLSIVIQGGPSMDLPGADGDSTRSVTAVRVADRLRRDLRGEYDLIDGIDPSARGAIVVGDRYPDDPPPAALPVWSVSVSSDLAPNVRIAAVQAPQSIPVATAVPLRAAVEAAGVRGSRTILTVRSGGTEVARTPHEWTSDRETWTAELDVVPIGAPPFTFDVDALPLPAERTPRDNHAAVHVAPSPPSRVLVFEARPSWTTAFVRRALEADSRLVVSAIARVSPRALVRTGPAPEWPPNPLQNADAIVVGGLEQLSASDVDALDRFVRVRGGSVALLPDAMPPASTRRLMPSVSFREVLLDRPAALAADAAPQSLAASEVLETDHLPPHAQVVARSATTRRAIVWSVERGEGRLLFSGALDAWRSRADSGVRFDAFWRSVVSGLALAARPAVDLTLTPQSAARGQRVSVGLRVRALERERLKDALSVSARVGGDRAIRLWPQAEPGVFAGSFTAASNRDQSPIVTAAVDGVAETASAPLFVNEQDVREAPAAPLSLLAQSRGGLDVGPSDVPTLERRLRAAIAGSPIREARHPMRSPWWSLPFMVSVCAEWWLRRRRGRR